MKTIKPLPEGVRRSMRSGIIMFDMTRVVEELLFNSLDAGATKVKPKSNRFSSSGSENLFVSIFVGVVTCSVKVVDDETYHGQCDETATSKFHDFIDVETASESFGFRGEALASISDISLLEITTKAVGRPNGYRKVMKGSKCLHLGIDDDRKDSGTTVTVRDLFYNHPVRQKYMQSRFISYTLRHPHSSSPRLKFCERCPCFYVKSFLSFSFCNGSPKKVLESITKCVFRIALVHSNVSFSVLDIDSDEELLQANPSASAFSLLMSDAGTEALNSLSKVDVKDGTLNVSGYISGPRDSFKVSYLLHLWGP
ncbi:hypothetical protein YC2023_088156 [Brassica napus]